MQNTKVLEMINNGQIEELKALLQDEIFTDSLKGNGNAKKRYSAMKKYFTYTKSNGNKALEKPCVIDFEGQKHTSFINGYSNSTNNGNKRRNGLIQRYRRRLFES